MTHANRPPQRWRARLRGRLLPAGGLLAAVAVVALLAYGVSARSPDTTIDDGLATQRPIQAPEFTLDVLDAGRVSAPLEHLRPALADGRLALGELRGTPFVLNIWASWCAPCREEAPVLQRGWMDARRVGVAFVGLDIQDAPGPARRFLRDFGIDYVNVREPGNRVPRRYGATGVPETYFVDRRGRVVGHVIGVIDASKLRDGVAAARAGRVMRVMRGGAQGAAD